MADEETPPPEDSWKNRRKMAWGAFLSLIAILLAMLYHILFKDGDPVSWTGIAGTIITAGPSSYSLGLSEGPAI